MTATLRIGISGSSGMIGTALARALDAAGHTVVPIVRRAARHGEIEWDPAAGRLAAADIAGLDGVVNLSGAGIGDQRWSDSYRALVMSSRTDTTGLLARTYAELGDDAPAVLVNASAIGWYGDRGDDELTETATAGDGFLADVCRAWEAATEPAAAVARVAIVRTGIVLSRDGGALAKMLPLFKVGLGGRFGDGSQWMSWISLTDEVRAIIHALTGDVHGPLNLTAPHPVTNRDFADALGDALGRPSFVPVPKFGPRLVLGRELADSLLFDSTRALPAALLASGFEFEHPDLATALAAVLT